MSKKKIKNYLAALLDHIPIENCHVLDFVSRIKEEADSDVLRLADLYSSAGQYETGNSQTFVASPFEALYRTEETLSYVYLPQEQNLTRGFFPKKRNEVQSAETKQGIEQLWSSFWIDFESIIDEEDLEKTSEKTLNLLYKYGVTIPNPSPIHPEVSWYDYVKVKAGFSVCLTDYLQAKSISTHEIKDEDAPILIFRSDVSGIQSFIQSIGSKNASKNLKGRSFYVQLLTSVIMRKMLKAFKLFKGNVLYNSGGNFFVLAPNIPYIKEVFEEFEEDITQSVFNEHGTNISIVMNYHEVSQKRILNGDIHLSIDELFEKKIFLQKKKKYAKIIAKNYEAFFDPIEIGGNNKRDVVTGEEIRDDEKVFYCLLDDKALPEIATSKNVDNPIRITTAKQIFLGHALKDTDFILFSEEKPRLKVPKYISERVVNPCGLGIYVCPISKGEKDIPFDLEKVERVSINNFNLSSSDVDGFMLYGGNKVPLVEKEVVDESTGEKRRKGDVKYFHEMAGEGDFKRLAVLRMDIDGLGKIFKTDIPYIRNGSNGNDEGQKRRYLSFPWYAALSRNLDWFFKGYLNTIWHENKAFRNNTQIIYSGGDDLFLIGRWDLIFAFAKQIKEEFEDFTCKSALTISAGISVITPKYPIIKAGILAGDAEHQAKAHKLFSENGVLFEKNSISFLNMPLHWDSEYKLVESLKADLLYHIQKQDQKEKGIPKSLLSKIYSFYFLMRSFEQHKISNRQANPRWIWMATYTLSRFIARVKGDHKKYLQELKEKIESSGKEVFESIEKVQLESKRQIDFLDDLKKGIFTNRYASKERGELTIRSGYHFLELLNLAARWAELCIRSDDKN